MQRGNGFLGYAHQGLSSGSPKTPNGSSEDMDFNDVFGGPPRRLSIQEVKVRYSFGDQVESEEEIVSSPWSSLTEKPVFGEDGVPKRRHPQGEDFFDDIFRGEDSYNSPRRTDRGRDNTFGLSPGSRILSPAKPLPPKAEPFSTSVPAQFSLPAKLTKGLEIPTFASNGQHKMDGSTNGLSSPHTSFSSSRFPSQVSRGQDENPVYRQSPLSHGVSHSSEDLPSMVTSERKENAENLKKDRRNVNDIGNQFHFSIYKWAGREVPMLFPLVGRDNLKARDGSKYDRSTSSNGRIESILSTRAMRSRGLSAAGSESLRGEEDMKLQNSVGEKSQISANNAVDYGGVGENVKEQVKSLDEVVIEEKAEKKLTMEKEESLGFELKKSLHVFLGDEIDAREKTEEKVHQKEEHLQSELKPLHAFLSEAGKLPGNKAEIKESKNRILNGIHRSSRGSKVLKKNEGPRISSNNGIMDKSSLQAAAINSGETTMENRVKGKVREFVQIFNKEADSKPEANVQRRSRSSRWKAVDTDHKENGIGTNAAEAKETVNFHDVAKKPEVSVKVDVNLNKDEANQRSPSKATSYTTHNSSSNQKNGFTSEKFRRDSKIYMEVFDDTSEYDFLVQELPDDHGKVTESEDCGDTKAIDANIQQWSSGKRGNIRSLLSTLQFVLWPECGWKPVPLADLIEANTVKKTYQKALLRLHPDKLQQKGAAFHQKYIAEKVFDILQEAWDQFNVLAPL